ncbi:hypothetical protein [Aurantiacibacter sediminis]|uniref:Uncharacterized protein n=1 Tax=Aurantiacibacter sediminis TaxID=2793064 RepID=A0ABS0N3L2_9SPHN|nr:hypothetical protein [Aurantiacibacter sediminis]MBH5322554.1 hypothetical protein [Aurantiacibacter sediminis]
MKRRFALPAAVSALTLALAACGDEPELDETTELAAEDEDVEVAAQSRDVTDFADLELGAKIVGPQGPEVKSRMVNAEAAFADITSYVACPLGMDPCDPATAPEGTIFTYVHIVYPGEDNDPTTGSGDGNDSSDVETMEAFRMTMPSHGFTGVAGYSIAEAQAALGEIGTIVVSCHEGGIAWTVEEGDGGDQWEQAEPITFFWQSTLPPAGPSEAYEVFANYTAAQGPGPYPAADETVTNACAVG